MSIYNPFAERNGNVSEPLGASTAMKFCVAPAARMQFTSPMAIFPPFPGRACKSNRPLYSLLRICTAVPGVVDVLRVDPNGSRNSVVLPRAMDACIEKNGD